MSKKQNGPQTTIGNLAAMDTSIVDSLRDAQTDDDAPDIPPALSEQGWAAWRSERLNPVTMMREVSSSPPLADNLVTTIAIANAQLHDEDPRKLTREDAALLRRAAEIIGAIESDDEATQLANGDVFTRLHEHADVIESYVEPEDADGA